MKVILHLGYPKTGSSSLQFGPFLDLEKIGYLILRTWRKLDQEEPLKYRPSSCLFQDLPIRKEYLDFSKKKINILSDESFTAPIKLREQHFNSGIKDPFDFPKKIRSSILSAHSDEDIDFKVIVVVREQSKLIESQYVEEYNWKRFKNIDLLFDKMGQIDLSGYEIYNFSKYLNLVESIFGSKNCFFFMFEEFTKVDEKTSALFDSILGSKKNFFRDSFYKTKLNGKIKSPLGTFTKDGKYFVHKFRDEIIDKIKDNYKEDNKKLTKFFSKQKLIENEYF